MQLNLNTVQNISVKLAAFLHFNDITYRVTAISSHHSHDRVSKPSMNVTC